MIKLLWPGKTKNKLLEQLIEEYARRIKRLVPLELIETKEARGLKSEPLSQIKAREADYFKKYIGNDYLVCLSDRGREMSSAEFSEWLKRFIETNSRPLTFIIGGFAGLDERLLDQADELLSLSQLTMSHELSRVVLLEQIYRALTLMKGWPYAK